VTRIREVPVTTQPLARFAAVIDPELEEHIARAAASLGELLGERVVWNVNSTEVGGGVAEMLRSLVGYARGAGIDARWIVIEGSTDFFRVTKRLHNALHGTKGDGSPLGEREQQIYEQCLHQNAAELSALVKPRDVVLLHDPQTAGLIEPLRDNGAYVIWRCHIGSDHANEEVERGWAMLSRYLVHAHALIFSCAEYVPRFCPSERTLIVPPSIDPFSAKNQDLDDATVRAILVSVGLVEGPPGPGARVFQREDGSPGRVDRCADVVRLGRAPLYDTPLVVQVSRWDRLKDPVGVLQGYASLLDGQPPAAAELVLAGPNVKAVADDPEGPAIFEEVEAAWRRLPHAHRKRVHLALLPTADVEENAAIVNALQRHASVVVQKSLREGFGLTVTEAMWKARPVLASAVGGIRDQIESGVHGILLEDPTDLAAFAAALRDLLEDRERAARLGRNARDRVRERFLGVRSLVQYAELIENLERAGDPGAAS
jgi:trehalose synthase